MKRTHIDITPAAFLGAAAAILLLPLPLLLMAVLAAAFHELCHYMALKICRIRVIDVTIGFLGTSISTAPLTACQEIICAAAGPIGSLSLLCLIHVAPILSLIGLFQGLFNLLPVYPLDGGRILWGVTGILKEKFLAKNGSWQYNRPD